MGFYIQVLNTDRILLVLKIGLLDASLAFSQRHVDRLEVGILAYAVGA